MSQYGGMSQQVDRRIVRKIEDLVGGGIQSVKEMQRICT